VLKFAILVGEFDNREVHAPSVTVPA
jgi:hypothetical protein